MCDSTRLVSSTGQLLVQMLIGALQVAQEAAAPHAAVASPPAGAASKRAEPNAELLLEKLREHILEKGARLPAGRAACRECLLCVAGLRYSLLVPAAGDEVPGACSLSVPCVSRC